MVINALYYVELQYTVHILYVQYILPHTILHFFPFPYKNITYRSVYFHIYVSSLFFKSLKAAGLLIGVTWILIATDSKTTRPNKCLLNIALFVTKIKCLVNIMHKIN